MRQPIELLHSGDRLLASLPRKDKSEAKSCKLSIAVGPTKRNPVSASQLLAISSSGVAEVNSSTSANLPSLPKASSANCTIQRFGLAWGRAASTTAHASCSLPRPNKAAQTVKAVAVERLMPLWQQTSKLPGSPTF